MRVRIPTTVELKFDEREREILRRATYYNPEHNGVEETDQVDTEALVAARARALQGTNGNAGYNDYLVQEVRALRDAVVYTVEDGGCDEGEHGEWSELVSVLDDAVDAIGRLDEHNSATKREIDTRY